MPHRFLLVSIVVTVTLAAAAGEPAGAIPVFAHRYGVTCQTCHTAIPTLNAYGRAFLENGYRLPGVTPGRAFPVAVKLNLTYTSAPDPGLPRAAVDEVELLTGGSLGSRGSYFIEHYAIDGGLPGNTREAWLGYRIGTEDARLPLAVRAGQFTLPLPVDPESFRETANHYAVFDQTVGANPFTFFAPKAGAVLRAGRGERGFAADVAVLQGHDVQSGLPATGADIMATVHALAGPFDLSVYRYAGRRAVAPGSGAPDDRFVRTGAGLRFERGRLTSENVLQTSSDDHAFGFGTATRASGGFSQWRYAFTPRFFALVRYDATTGRDGAFHGGTVLVGYRLARNARLTLEDVFARDASTSRQLNAQLTIAY